MPTYHTTSIGELTPGSVLVAPAFDERRFKLLDAGCVVDQQMINKLQSSGITEVIVERPHKAAQPKMTLADSAQTIAVVDEIIEPVDRSCICGRRIFFQPPTPDAQAVVWLCDTCNAVYFGSQDDQSEGVRLATPSTVNSPAAAALLAAETQPTPPQNIQRLVQTLTSNEQPGADRRKHPRYAVTVPVLALPLASDFRVVGEPVKMTTANISLGGAALIHTRFVKTPYFALDFAIAGLELLLVFKVLRVQNRGIVYEIGGEFISRLSQFAGA